MSIYLQIGFDNVQTLHTVASKFLMQLNFVYQPPLIWSCQAQDCSAVLVNGAPLYSFIKFAFKMVAVNMCVLLQQGILRKFTFFIQIIGPGYDTFVFHNPNSFALDISYRLVREYFRMHAPFDFL